MNKVIINEKIGHTTIVKFPKNKKFAIVPLYGTGLAYHVSNKLASLTRWSGQCFLNHAGFIVIHKSGIIIEDYSNNQIKEIK